MSTARLGERVEPSVLHGLAAFRWLAWVWMGVVLLLARHNLVAVWVAFGLLGLALAVTAWTTFLLRRRPRRLTSPGVVGVEVATALALQLADGFVYRAPHVFAGTQPLGVAWPIAAILSAGVAFGPLVGAAVGVVLGAARALSSILNLVPTAGGEPWVGPLTSVQALALATTTVMYALAGGVVGYAVRLLREAEARVGAAERRLAEARAREDVGRRLHDGVLQTLALVERRAEDPQLARLAREQERDLRTYLFGGEEPAVVGAGALGDVLRRAANRFESRFGTRSEVLVPDDLPQLDEEVVAALEGAVTEALTNVGKHAAAQRVVVYVEPHDGGVFVSVRDDGRGFDPAVAAERIGLSRSIRGRMAEVGGGARVASSPGRGTEVTLDVPPR